MKNIRGIEGYERGGERKIFVITANAVKGVKEELLEEGFDEYLKKPIEFGKLEEVLLKHISPDKVSVTEGEDRELNENGDSMEILTESMIPGVDMKEGLMHCGGEMEDYIEILELTVETGRGYLQSMPDKIDSQTDQFVIEIHACKGMCYNIGAKECGDLAKALEMAGREADLELVHREYFGFTETFEALLNAIEKFVFESKGNNASSKNDLSFESAIEQIKKAAEDYDIPTAQKILDQILNCQVTPEERAKLAQIKVLIEDVDFDGLMNL